jgi:hypothetical protein
MASKSLPWLKAQGWQVGKVGDHWNAFAPRGDGQKGILQDLWGFADALICRPGTREIALVNWCAADRRADHRRTLLSSDKAIRWLESGGKLFILSWRVGGPRGERKRWTPDLEEVTVQDFDLEGDQECPEGVEETFPDAHGARPWPLE